VAGQSTRRSPCSTRGAALIVSGAKPRHQQDSPRTWGCAEDIGGEPTAHIGALLSTSTAQPTKTAGSAACSCPRCSRSREPPLSSLLEPSCWARQLPACITVRSGNWSTPGAPLKRKQEQYHTLVWARSGCGHLEFATAALPCWLQAPRSLASLVPPILDVHGTDACLGARVSRPIGLPQILFDLHAHGAHMLHCCPEPPVLERRFCFPFPRGSKLPGTVSLES
jgi:hypothetical protein